MAGDQGGWYEALWVPITGIVMVMAIWAWDRVFVVLTDSSGYWTRHLTFPLEVVRSSLHQPRLGSSGNRSGLGSDVGEVFEDSL